MRIAVTGGAGNVGGFVVDELADNGHVPMIIDTAFPHISEMPPRHRINIRRADLTDLGQAIAAVEGCEAVIHLAAIPHPFWDSRPKVFLHNITCLYNTLEAARQAGIDKVVTASSDSTLGFSFAYNPFQPDYFPIDEVHPLRPQDPYCLSKAVGEDICRSMGRTCGMSAVSLRFCRVLRPEAYNEVVGMAHENPKSASSQMWTYIDVRDVAHACRVATEQDGLDCEVFFISSSQTYMETPTRDLMAKYYPDAEDRYEGDDPYFSPFENAKTLKVLGWEPLHHWRDNFQQ